MNSPLKHRRSGVLLHPSSLPGLGSHGDIGPEARRFIDFLQKAGQTWWQMLPIHPLGGGNSPYDSSSAFAGSELLLSLDDLVPLSLLTTEEVRNWGPAPNPAKADFECGRESRRLLLRKAFARFQCTGSAGLMREYDSFLSENQTWVWDFALFSAHRSKNGQRSWTSWAPELRQRQQEALNAAHSTHRDEVLFLVFCQFLFHFQWEALHLYARDRGVLLMGDIPMFVSHDSADVWANQEMFFLDKEGERTVQAGVPPDYFSEFGQLWGNPLYRWNVMQADGYGWWIDRLKRELAKFDVVRLDHFIAFSRYWEIPVPADSAKEGRFVEVPGSDFFEKAQAALGGLPFVAEDLGLVTQAVEALRDNFSLPGMKLLHFAFTDGAESYLPHHHPQTCVAYLGTHDNNTTRGWFESLLSSATKEEVHGDAKDQLRRIDGYSGAKTADDACPCLIRTLMASSANTTIITAQDLLNQGSDARMNVPGIGEGNWTYRMKSGDLTDALAEALFATTLATERLALAPSHRTE